MYVVELVLPLLIFVPARLRVLRWLAFMGLAGFELLIAATGNYGFFSLLTIGLCLLLVDDEVWQRVLPQRLWARGTEAAGSGGGGWAKYGGVAAGGAGGLPVSGGAV